MNRAATKLLGALMAPPAAIASVALLFVALAAWLAWTIAQTAPTLSIDFLGWIAFAVAFLLIGVGIYRLSNVARTFGLIVASLVCLGSGGLALLLIFAITGGGFGDVGPSVWLVYAPFVVLAIALAVIRVLVASWPRTEDSATDLGPTSAPPVALPAPAVGTSTLGGTRQDTDAELTSAPVAGRLIVTGSIVAIVVLVGIAIVLPVLDRASRTVELPDIASANAIHVSPDGRLVITERGDASGPNGRVLVIDPLTERREIALDDLWEARAADMSSDGIVCATLGGDRGASPELRCSDGRSFAMVYPEGSAQPKAISPGDVVWDGESGWYVADPANFALLRVDAAGRVAALPTTFEIPYWINVPVALATTSDGRVLVSAPERGVVVGWPAMDIPEVVVGKADTIVGIAVSKTGTFVLARMTNVNIGRISWCCHASGREETILDGIHGPSGLALLPDGRLAIVSDGKVLLYRPDLPDGGA